MQLLCQESEPDLRVRADPEHLRRLWLILLHNTIRYTPGGGVIRVFWYRLSPEFFACEISDNGIGISKADLPHIFKRFFRADKARSREEGGAGLGLALARWIVDAHDAGIDAESRFDISRRATARKPNGRGPAQPFLCRHQVQLIISARPSAKFQNQQ